MKDFNDLVFEPHSVLGFNTMSKLFFENGYGVSVITGGYGNSEGPYELAVLQGNESIWTLTYSTPITDDVLGYLTENDVSNYMERVQSLLYDCRIHIPERAFLTFYF